MQFGSEIIRAVRTILLDSGVRSVWYLPGGKSIHAIEDNPILPGTYFLRPDQTGRFRNWVIESMLGSRIATPEYGRLTPARTDVEVHVGNTLADTEGCTCPGLETSLDGVKHSRRAIKLMRDILRRDEKNPPVWILEISE